ncbi:MAG: NfeD family protein [Granulosicoccus sp.]
MMDIFLNNQPAFWLALGFLLLAIELIAFGLGSGVLLFGSIGAVLTGALLWFGIIPAHFIAGVACFAVSTTIATAALWYPLKKLQSGAELGNDRSSDLIGHTFVLGGDISRTLHAQQKYSGIQWRVEPSQDIPDKPIQAGTQVKVTAVSVGVFFVQPVDL